MKRNFTTSVISAIVLLSFFSVSRAADLKNPKEIIKLSQEYTLSLDSYSYTAAGEGWDINAAETAKRTSSAAGEAAQKFKVVESVAKDVKKTADTETVKPTYKHYKCSYKFKKPYLLQEKVIMSEYVPKIVYGSIMTYRPDQDPKVFYFKPKISPVAISRGIDTESGDLLSTTFAQIFATLDAMSKDTAPVFKGVYKVKNKGKNKDTVPEIDAYAIEWKFADRKKLKPHTVDFKLWGIPDVAHKIFEKDINSYVRDPVGRAVYFFDKTTLLIISREVYDTSNKLLNREDWYDIKTNNLTEKDF